MNQNRINLQSERGVTLVELLVVLSILVFILGATASIFISVLQGQNRVLQDQELFSQVSYLFDDVSQSIRDSKRDDAGTCLGSGGYNFKATHGPLIGGGPYQGIKFIAKDGVCVEFYLDIDGVFKEVRGVATPLNLLSDKFIITYIRFIVNGNKSTASSIKTDRTQSRVTMVMSVKTKGSNPREKIIQTTVSPRNLNKP